MTSLSPILCVVSQNSALPLSLVGFLGLSWTLQYLSRLLLGCHGRRQCSLPLAIRSYTSIKSCRSQGRDLPRPQNCTIKGANLVHP